MFLLPAGVIDNVRKLFKSENHRPKLSNSNPKD